MLICIDAGHCLSTPGKRCLKSIDLNETREWVLNSRVADKLEAILAGYSCQTMRVDDVTGQRDVPLSQRVAAANRARADVYLSIHHNAGINGGSGGGIVAYVAPSHQRQSEVVRDAVYRYTVAATGLRGNRAQPLAEQSLYVLNYTTMPATLIELGFMDSTTDTPIILTERFADEAAAGLAAALVDVYDLQARRRLEPVATLSAEEFRVEVVAAAKRSIAGDYINAGYFGSYSEAGERFALPAGHLAGIYTATGRWMRHYAEERGRFVGDRWIFDSSRWAYANLTHGRPVTTVYTQGSQIRVAELVSLPDDVGHAVSGIPLIRDGRACTVADITAQGWDTSPLRSTWHTVLAVDDGRIHVFAWESQSDNLVTSGEAARAFAGYRDVVKLDGGGSFICRQNGEEQSTAEDRVICSILRLPEKQEELELTEDQERFDRMMEDWMERRAKEPASQWAQAGLEQAKAKGITDGTRPRSMATREEVALMVNKAVEIR
nr:MAG TPA: Cell wall hydrolase autolysin [Caudoviricetes sp.]